MSLTPFRQISGVAALLLQDNVDTDAIAPSHLHVPGLGRAGYEAILFGNWRWDPDGAPKPDFILNQEPFGHAVVLIAGNNFGCGSSRETAAWALKGFGIRAVVARSFGAIFEANCLRNGLLPVSLPGDSHAELVEDVRGASLPEVEVDLERCALRAPSGTWHEFEIDHRDRDSLLKGDDEIDQILRRRPAIDRFGERDRLERPWLYVDRPAH